jgi:predicted acylesterase/phospholipase RssA
MYQIGALAALEDCFEGANANEFDLYVGTSSGATVAAALAGGAPVQRLYRSLLDPGDAYFPLERKHILRMDFSEWRRSVLSAVNALRHGSVSLFSRTDAPTPAMLWEQLDRLYDSLPAGLFSLDAYERFLSEFFARRNIANSFAAMPRALRILAHDLDSGQKVFFGDPGFEHIPVTHACAASMALPPFFSPVRIGERHYIDAGAAQVAHLDIIQQKRARVAVVINPLVPVRTDSVPTGHGERPSVRDKGSMWVTNQANRIGVNALLHERLQNIRRTSDSGLILIEPQPTDAILFMHNAASFAARRAILEYAYRTTRERITASLSEYEGTLERANWCVRTTEPAT